MGLVRDSVTEWISVFEELPKPDQTVWIWWRDREVVVGCKVDYECDPDWGWYSFEDDKCKWTKFWSPIRLSPRDMYSPQFEAIINGLHHYKPHQPRVTPAPVPGTGA